MKLKITNIIMVCIIVLVMGYILYGIIKAYQNPAPEDEICPFLNSEEQRVSYNNYKWFKYVCEEKGLSFLGVGHWVNKVTDEDCNINYCCRDLDGTEHFFCRDENTLEIRRFSL